MRFYLSGYQPTAAGDAVTLLAVHDPGYGLVIAGGALLLLGVTVALAFPHSSVHARIAADGTLRLAGFADRGAIGFGQSSPGWPLSCARRPLQPMNLFLLAYILCGSRWQSTSPAYFVPRWLYLVAVIVAVAAWAALTFGLIVWAERRPLAVDRPLRVRPVLRLGHRRRLPASKGALAWRECRRSARGRRGSSHHSAALLVATSRLPGRLRSVPFIPLPAPFGSAPDSRAERGDRLWSLRRSGRAGAAEGAAGPDPAADRKSPQRSDRRIERTVAWGFPWLTLSILTGAIWAQEAWGRYWGWDPKETWALITWLWYLLVLHLRACEAGGGYACGAGRGRASSSCCSPSRGCPG